jgi:hypothetical protein
LQRRARLGDDPRGLALACYSIMIELPRAWPAWWCWQTGPELWPESRPTGRQVVTIRAAACSLARQVSTEPGQEQAHGPPGGEQAASTGPGQESTEPPALACSWQRSAPVELARAWPWPARLIGPRL